MTVRRPRCATKSSGSGRYGSPTGYQPLILQLISRESATALSERCMHDSHLLGKLCGGVEQHVLQEMSQAG